MEISPEIEGCQYFEIPFELIGVDHVKQISKKQAVNPLKVLCQCLYACVTVCLRSFVTS